MNKFKKIFVTCSTVAIISGVNIHSAFAVTGTVSSETVRMREEASTSSKIVVNLDIGDKVEIISEDGDWYKVKYKTYEGYMHKDYVKAEENTELPQENNDEDTEDNSNAENNDDNLENNNEVEDNNNAEDDSNNQIDEPDNAMQVQESKSTYIGKEFDLKNDSDLYLLPVLSSSKINKIQANTTVRGIQETNNWVKISYSNIEGWVSKNNLPEIESDNEEQPVENNEPTVEDNEPTVEDNNEQPKETPNSTTSADNNQNTSSSNKKAYINVSFANIRESANSNSDVIISLKENTEVTILDEENDFYKITSEKVKEGYVAKRLVSGEQVTSRSSTIRSVDEENNEEAPETISNSSGQEIADFAKQYLGYDYVYGGTTPSNGFDCSGYTYYVYSNNGIDISRNLSAQASLGEEVDEDNIQIGDLIIFMDEGMNGVGHSGIYIGNNQFIHAANPKRGVVTDSMSNDYYGPRIVTIRRVI